MPVKTSNSFFKQETTVNTKDICSQVWDYMEQNLVNPTQPKDDTREHNFSEGKSLLG